MSTIFLAKSSATALTTAKAVMAVGAVASNNRTTAVPNGARLGKIEIQLTGIAGAASVSFYLARKSNGDEPVTPTVTKAITGGVTAATGSVAEHYIYEPYLKDAADDGLFVVASLDAGTATGTARLTGER